ncbi:STAS domain-containing protein [Amycolatopsis sp. NBC_01488]|uniref:STAS domain-containing protein n=1 Tax=Amycolatopsis sp. NBC_01488 TaxID=2903563 RepID=UPI002E2CBD10|nr:STAS domain-containing protein [Amycolatopsis sp. NBC_01488]
MRIQKPPRLSRAFGRSSPGALCEPFSVTTSFPGDRSTLLVVVGDIDLATVAILVECAETAMRRDGALVVDLARVTFCSGVGLRALRRIQRRAGELAVPLAWVVRTPAIWRLPRGTGVAGFSCYRDRADALAASADLLGPAAQGARPGSGKKGNGCPS